jgi:nitric oxide dioxygenase
MSLLETCIGKLHDFSALAPAIKNLGTRHAGYGATPEHYAIVAEALLWSLARGLGATFTPDVRSAWTKVYELLATTMQAEAAKPKRVASSSRSPFAKKLVS